MIKLFVFPFLIFSSMWGVSFLDQSPFSFQSESKQTEQILNESKVTISPHQDLVSPSRAPSQETSVEVPKPVVKPRVTLPRATTTAPAQVRPTPEVVLPPPSLPTTPATSSESLSTVTQLEVRIAALLNSEREAHGLQSLSSDTLLGSVARAHSLDMQEHSYFSHTDTEGCSSSCRLSKVEYAWSAVGENIYTMNGYAIDVETLATMAVRGWMNSSGHRANILSGKFTHQGVGVSIEQKKVMITTVYATPRP